ncbi:multiple sugar transport system permease protein [Lacrimispora xylanisolvens]|uniref:Multiple sugar transport system permease protein n=1 Tax=Lacrimispora xylanisolvens TaxID=384636 RepID=A0A2S6HSR9_9FIRM|nr:carbohydrate ABC transporter permease [Hungatella xylanolytica]PPK80796.1 multiple sugar transport system permease protein [Hungatella xylanolytica]
MAKERTGHSVESQKTKMINVVIFLLLATLAFFTVYPVIYILFGSFKTNNELVRGGVNLLPQKFILDNYKQAWQMANFSRYTMNSLVLSFGVMAVSLTVSSMAGYVFSRKEFKLKSLIYNSMVMFMFINVGSVALRPLFELAVKLHMNKSLISIILISAGGGQATYVFLIHGFMNSIPKEMDEAAKIDGCSFFGIYYRVILPVIKPALASVALLSFRGGWNEYILPLIFTMTNEKLRPLTVGVVALQNAGDGAAAWNILFAGSAIAIVPIILVYMAASKQFMGGMTAGAVKG